MNYLLVVLVLVIPIVLKAQEQSFQEVFDAQSSRGYLAGNVTNSSNAVSVLINDSVVWTTGTSNENKMVDVVIEFNDEPLMKTLAGSRKKYGRHNPGKIMSMMLLSKKHLDYMHKKFKSEIQKINDQDTSKHSSTIKHEYLGAFNGFSVRTSYAHIKKLRNMAMVKKVHPDYQVNASLAESVGNMHADVLQASGYTGKGIVVGVIDAGIDYTHPALGGGFGPSYKVIGGYDFVNKDTDPMDDNKHGTHVAGIIAANGEVRGVSPDVKLVAYKVLNSSGNGLMSDVVAAVERSCDPDGDPLTDDALDVINLSLGGPGNSSDPLCQAIENATENGVVCVVAAGNRGSFQSIESPGCATSAITVGAVDDLNKIAYFSSKGPTSDLFGIKPDVLAPGVGITSTLPGNAYGEQSGTSMATPHVAGLAAILKQIHPDWNPEKIKECIMLSSDSCNANVFSQGCGMVNGFIAANQTTLVNPASISLGIDTAISGTSVKSTIVTIYNTGSKQRTYQLSASLYSQQPGISLNLSPDMAVVQPGDSVSVLFTLTMDNSMVPEIPDAPFAYMGSITIDGRGESVRVPFAIIKNDVIRVHLREFPTLMIIHDRTGKQTTVYSFDTTTTIIVPHGTYDIIAYYAVQGAYIARENILSGSEITIGLTDAIHTASITTVDIKGAPIQCTSGMSKFKHKASGINIMTAGNFRYSNSFSTCTDYTWEWSCFKYDHDTIHQFSGMSSAFSKDTSFINTRDNLRKYLYHYNIPPGMSDPKVSFCTSSSPFGNWYYNLIRMPDNQLLTIPYIQTAFFMPSPSEEFSLGFTSNSVYNSQGTAQLFCQSPFLQVNSSSSAAMYLPGCNGTPLYKVSGNIIEVGSGPMFWMGRFTNASNLFRIIPFHGNQQFAFANQTGDLIPQRGTRYTLYQNRSPVLTDTFICNGANITPYAYISPGTYTFVSQFNSFFVGDRPGCVKVSATFNTLFEDKDPPLIRKLWIESDGRPIATIRPDQPAQICFELWDSLNSATGTAFYHGNTDTTWIPLSVTSEGMRHTIIPPSLTSNTYIALKIIAIDASGNELICEMDPFCKFEDNAKAPPVLEPIGNKCINENGILKFTIQSLNPDGGIRVYSTSTLPPGAIFDSATATFTWQPNYSQAGIYTGISFMVTDGISTYTETITITVNNTNRLPVAVNDLIYTDEDQPVTFDVLSNDIDEDSDPIILESVVNPYFGSFTINANNTITYIPRPNYSGLDQFAYTISDGQGGYASAMVLVNIAAVNDPPLVQITTPTEMDVFNKIKSVRIKAIASDIDDSVSAVGFFINDILLCFDTTPPYTFKWENLHPGRFSLRCKVFDTNGGASNSSTVNIEIK